MADQGGASSGGGGGGENGSHPLSAPWTFYTMDRESNLRQSNYGQNKHVVGTVATVEEFWGVFAHMKPIDEIDSGNEVLFFREGVEPKWEDPSNTGGGKFVLRIRKGIAGPYWEALLLALAGDTFEHPDDICGAFLSLRNREDVLSLWVAATADDERAAALQDNIRDLLLLPDDANIEYRAHNTPYPGTPGTDSGGSAFRSGGRRGRGGGKGGGSSSSFGPRDGGGRGGGRSFGRSRNRGRNRGKRRR